MSPSGAASLVLADESSWSSDGIADRQACMERRTADRLQAGRIQACVHFRPPTIGLFADCGARDSNARLCTAALTRQLPLLCG